MSVVCIELKATRDQIETLMNLKGGDLDVKQELAYDILEQNDINTNFLVTKYWEFEDINPQKRTVRMCFANNMNELIKTILKRR